MPMKLLRSTAFFCSAAHGESRIESVVERTDRSTFKASLVCVIEAGDGASLSFVVLAMVQATSA